MITSRRALFIILFFIIIIRGYSQVYDSLEIKIDQVIQEAISRSAFPGCVVYAAQGDTVLFFKAYGHHTYDSLVEVKPTDIYDLASVTKVVGASLALMKLYEDGHYNLDDPIGAYVEDLGKKVGSVTFRASLAHQAGLYPWIPFYQAVKRKNGSFKKKTFGIKSEEFDFALNDSLYLHRDFYQKIKKMIRKSPVSDEHIYRYSGLFFYLVPELVHRFTGLGLDQYLQRSFYDSLDAQTIGFRPLERFDQSRIVPTENDTYFRMKQIHGTVHDEGAITMKGVSGNAGLFGNAEDLAKVWQMLLNDGEYDGISYLKPETIALFTTAQFPNNNNRRALGFDKPLLTYDSIRSSVARDASYLSYGHSGFTGTLAWADPANDCIFIFLTNRVYPTRENRALYNLNIRPTIHQLIYDYLKYKKVNPVLGATRG